MADDFSSLTLPPHLLRNSCLRPKFHTEGYLDALDRETLWYDAVWSDGTLTLICPPLHNLRRMFRNARFLGDDQPIQMTRLRRYARHDVAEFKVPNCPTLLTIEMAGWTGHSQVSAAEHGLFQGLNTAFFMSKDNSLSWLVDHAFYYQKQHGLQVLIVLDNGSTEYGVQDIQTVLAPLGLDHIKVLQAPFKYGPIGLKPYRRTEKFLQTALFNVLRLRFLAKARAILNCDVDELIVSWEGASIFDAACQSLFGFVQVKGRWVYPAPGITGPFTHAHHAHTRHPAQRCPPKWCLSPTGPLGGFSWDIHGMERLPFLRRRVTEDFHFVHCRGLTTGWKNMGRLTPPKNAIEDSALRDHLAAAFGK